MTKTTAIDTVKNTIQHMRGDFVAALPAHIPADRFIKTVLLAIAADPDLANADRTSLYAACMKAAQDGLILDNREAALVTFGGKVQYMPMVAGLIKKVNNSGNLFTIDAQEVFENDEFESWVDEKGQHFKHKKARKNRGLPILTYAYALTKDGAIYYEEMDEEQMAAVENVSKAKGKIWKGPFRGEMKRKSVTRRLIKRLPMSTDIDNVIRAMDEEYDFTESKPEPIVEGKKETKAASVIKASIKTEVIDVEPATEEGEDFI